MAYSALYPQVLWVLGAWSLDLNNRGGCFILLGTKPERAQLRGSSWDLSWDPLLPPWAQDVLVFPAPLHPTVIGGFMLLLLEVQSLATPGPCQVDLLELNQKVPPHGWSANHPCLSPGSEASKNGERDQEGASLRNPKVFLVTSGHLERDCTWGCEGWETSCLPHKAFARGTQLLTCQDASTLLLGNQRRAQPISDLPEGTGGLPGNRSG